MAILSTVKKFLPYVKTATGYVLYRLSSQAVQMDDGNTLQAAYNSLNSKLNIHFVDGYNEKNQAAYKDLYILSGVKVLPASSSSSSKVLFTRDQVYDMFGVSSGWPNQFAVFVSNGDAAAASHHIEGTSFQGGNLYIVLNTNSTVAMRVCYTILHWR